MNRVTTTFTAGVFAMLATALILSCALPKPPAYLIEENGKIVYVYYDSLAYEGKTYKTIKMPDGKVWMAENLSYAVGNSKCNTDIHHSTGYTAGSGKLITYCDEYGSFYNWEDAMKACPAGWHLPTKEEWAALIAVIGEKEAGKALKSGFNRRYNASEWRKYVLLKEGYGSDKYGFTVRPVGNYNYNEDSLSNFGLAAFFWTSSEYKADSAEFISFLNSRDDSEWRYAEKNLAFLSVRCVEGPAPEPAAKSEPAAMEGPAAAPEAAAPVAPPIEIKAEPAEPIKDPRDKKTYKAVKIGEQTWMAENLNFNTKGSKCYDNKDANCKKYGRLYDKEMAKAACPAGWHLPSKEEWKALLKAAGIDEYESLSALKAKSGWKPDNGGGNGTDKFGFAALPGGLYGSYDHSEYCGDGDECRGEAFMHGSDNGFWHSANDGYSFDGYYYVYNVPPFNYMWLGGWYYSNTSFLSVRCVKD